MKGMKNNVDKPARRIIHRRDQRVLEQATPYPNLSSRTSLALWALSSSLHRKQYAGEACLMEGACTESARA